MNQIDNITDQATQETQIVLDDGSILTLTLFFRSATLRWTFDLVHELLTVYGMSLCVSPNMLRPWIELIPFGLACVTTDGEDPVNVDDFLTGRATLYSLNAEDVAGVEENVIEASA